MKFNEQQLKNLLNSERSHWDTDDINWFNLELFNHLENKLLDSDSHQKIINMMAHDQTVMNHFLALKEQAQTAGESSHASYFFKGSIWAILGVLVVAITALLSNQMPQDSSNQDMSRGVDKSLIYPSQQASLTAMPDYFVGPKTKQVSRIELRQNDQLVWQSEWQDSPRFFVPLALHNTPLEGTFNWQVMTKENTIIYQGNFNVAD